MTSEHQGLYPIIRRVRRPLVSIDAVTSAPAVVPVKTPEPPRSQPPVRKKETRPDAVPPETNG
jgi:hypothetical protein